MTTPIGAVGTVSQAAANTDANATATTQSLLDPQAFLQLLVAQLKYQDPTSPVDTASFMNQTATLSQVQTMGTMSSTLESLMHMQQVQAGTDMLGKQVTYTDSAGGTHTGVVSSVSGASSNVTVMVGNASVALNTISQIEAAPTSSGTTP